MDKNLRRVNDNLSGLIIEFCAIAGCSKDFHMESLRRFINLRGTMCAPASPDRVLRDLRKRGKVNYKVVSRSQSLYRIIPTDVNKQISLPLAA